MIVSRVPKSTLSSPPPLSVTVIAAIPSIFENSSRLAFNVVSSVKSLAVIEFTLARFTAIEVIAFMAFKSEADTAASSVEIEIV